MPGAGFVVIEAEFVLGGFETVLDGPAMSFDRYQLPRGSEMTRWADSVAKVPKIWTVIFSAETYTSESRY
jgi:hypothetical protein